MTEPIHVVDATMFWSATGGGVRRYLLTKHDWLARRPGWRHTIAVPGDDVEGAGRARLPSLPLPGSGGYRLPLRRGAIARVLARSRARPDRVRRPLPRRLGRARRGALPRHPGGGDLPLEPRGDGPARRRRPPRRRRRQRGAALPAARLPRLRPGAGAEPQHAQPPARLGRGARRPAAARRRHRRVPSAARGGVGLARPPRPGRRGPGARLRRPIRRREASRRARRRGGATRAAARAAGDRRRADAAGAASGCASCRSSPTSPRWRRSWPVPRPSSTPATRRPSACRRSRRWPAARRSSCARRRAWPSSPTVRHGLAVERGTGAAFAEAIAALLAADRPAQRRAARARAEANDWAQVLPALLGHYRRLLDGRTASPRPAAVERPLEASSLPPAR